MKELIDKLSLGITEYTKPVMEVSVSTISLKMEAERLYSGEFQVVSTNGRELKGIIFSTDSRLVIENNQFIGKDNTIYYKVNTSYVNQGEEIKGDINIISNGGEMSVPFIITVDSVSADTTTGSVRNLYHFANLVQMSYDEAVKLFSSPSFPHVFLENDLPLMAVYNGLIGSSDINVAMEEFLVAANKKSPIHISVAGNSKEYSNIEENYGDIVTVSKNTWGYVNIDIEITGDFLGTDRKNLTGNDFAGSNYELSYYIKRDILHTGRNYGRIRLVTSHQTIDYNIIVSMDGERLEASAEYKKAVNAVIRNYLDFRIHKINLKQWAEASDTVITRARAMADSMFMKLIHAQVYITQGRDSDGAWLLENVAEDLLPKRQEEIELYCYYLYVRTIQKRDDEFTGEIIKKIKGYYENGHDSWQILWVLLYLDDTYDNNISLKVLRVKEQYLSGMRSPMLYFEALSCFNQVPEMLRVLDEFEIQVLNFGIKNDYINKKLAMQINDITKTERKFNPIIFSILTVLYDKYGTDEFLENICSMLIKGNRTDEKYFKWFAEGIDRGLKITSLYEYYMYTMSSEFDGVIPQMVMMYFVYNSTTLTDEKIDLLYTNIIKNKNTLENVYNAYKAQFEKYVADNVLLGRMNKNLAIIYQDIFTKTIVGPEMAEKMPEVLNTYQVCCDEPNMREVLIVHKEINQVSRYPLKKGVAYVHIYTEDPAVIFEDIDGNRYSQSVRYTKSKLLDMEEYLRMYYEISAGNKALVLYFGDKYLIYRKNPEKSISILKYMLHMEGLIKPFRLIVENEIIDYYSANYDGDSLDEYLLTVSAENLGSRARVKIIELTIIRGLYDRAYELVSKFGFYMVEPRRVLKCSAKLIESREFETDNIIIQMAAFAFFKGKYNEATLNYLSRHYNGTTKELLTIWKAARDFQCENRELEEKIIVQMLFTGAYVGRTEEIYDSYFKKGANSKVKKAYLFSKSYDYFVKEQVIEESIFKYIEKDVYNGDEINDMCAMAFLKYMSEQESLSEDYIDICRNLVYELSKVNKVFGFYKSFKKYFRLPYAIADKTIIEYRTCPGNSVFIHYIMETGNVGEDVYSVEKMTNVCDGVFIYSTVLFYGENMQYYITEECGEQVTVTESSRISVGDVEFSNDSTHYGTINDMLVCREMHEEKTFERMSKDYIIKKKLMDTIFTIL